MFVFWWCLCLNVKDQSTTIMSLSRTVLGKRAHAQLEIKCQLLNDNHFIAGQKILPIIIAYRTATDRQINLKLRAWRIFLSWKFSRVGGHFLSFLFINWNDLNGAVAFKNDKQIHKEIPTRKHINLPYLQLYGHRYPCSIQTYPLDDKLRQVCSVQDAPALSSWEYRSHEYRRSA